MKVAVSIKVQEWMKKYHQEYHYIALHFYFVHEFVSTINQYKVYAMCKQTQIILDLILGKTKVLLCKYA